jgi:sterol desaturase/sphingolipid hydroxylase (fatty acid hydroxylase superfamily)
VSGTGESESAAASLAVILKIGPWLFAGTVLAFALWETFRPKVHLVLSAPRRWGIHFCLSLIPSVVTYLVPGFGAVMLSFAARSNPWGVLNHAAIPYSVQIVCTIPALDFVTYWRHRSSHAIPLGWRLHLLHHSDRDFDFTDGFRFHPVEAILIMAVQALGVYMLAPPPLGVALTAILVSLNTIYTHANIELPDGVERALRFVFITPGLHRLHHLEAEAAQHRNFGDLFSFWDRLFGTLLEDCADPTIGVREIPAERCTTIAHVAGAPFGL